MKSLLAVILLLFAFCPFIKADENRLVIGAEGNKALAIVDPADGNKVLWSYDRNGPVHDLHLLDSNHFITQNGGWLKIEEIGLDKKVAWKYDASKQNRSPADSKRIEIHAFQRLADGSTMIVESGTSRIIEVDAEGKLLKEISLEVDKPSPHSDTRLVRKLENGHYLAAHEDMQSVKEYDASGKVVWHYPVPLFGKKPAGGHGPEAWGGRCFSASKTKEGNYLITTGNGHSVIEVTPEKEIVWHLQQSDLKDITLAWVTNVHQLDNGNLIVGNCHAGPENPQLFEITKDKEVVWTFTDFKNFGNALANTLVIDGDRAIALRKALK